MNVNACLVHEKPDLVRDLVANLRALDPQSVVLLYNGGKDSRLLDGDWGDGVVQHPHPRPMAYGRLHGYMLDCMSYCLAHIPDFTCITVVDSDQVATKPGYCNFVCNWLDGNPGVGCLGTHHLAPADTMIGNSGGPCVSSARAVARPWRERFSSLEGGGTAYGHWSYWPSTVFAYEAAWRLNELASRRPDLMAHIDRSRVFATEEVFLPSLVAAVGLRVERTPCNPSYVRFDDRCAVDVGACADADDAYWMHRVPRDMDHPVRLAMDKMWAYRRG